jgi:hypothetical protein
MIGLSYIMSREEDRRVHLCDAKMIMSYIANVTMSD